MSKCCIKSTAVTATATALEITIPEMTFQNCCKYNIFVAQEIPCSAIGLPVIIVSGSTKIPVWTCGNAVPVLAAYVKGQLGNSSACKCNVTYTIPVQYVNSGVETNPEHFSVTVSLKVCCNLV